ncbi:lariat debranching enzyme, partial [Neophaeococcomyces mojaviensis]
IEDKLGHEQELAASQEERAQNGRQKTTSHDFEEAYRPAHIKETEQALSRYSQFAQNIAPRTPHYDRTCFSKSNCRRKSTPSGGVQQHEKLEQVVDSAPGKPVELVDHISEELRTEAGGISQLFAPGKKFGKSPDLPLPQTITNKVTQFLALSKPENGFDDEFLQLLEVEPINIEDKSIPLQKPFKLQYDPEWLAILRTFASETRVGGSPSGKIPSHRGDTHYRDRIIEEEKWVQENIVKKGLLDVPENFEITVNTNEQEDGDTKNDDEMPQEQTNPQTVKFCNLIGIENKFDFSEEDRNARMASGVSARKQR